MASVYNYECYDDAKRLFFKMHRNNFRTETSAMDELGGWHKEYLFEDGAVWYEVYTPVTEQAEAQIHGMSFKVDVKLLKTEFWSTDDSKSNYYYERW